MAETIRVKAGEHVPRIAADKGFSDWKTIWDDSHNKGLKDTKRTPCILNPNDSLYIPDKGDKKVGKSTGSMHTFTAPLTTLKLRLTLKNVGGKALSSVPYQLKSTAFATGGSTDGSGKVETTIPIKTEQADIVMNAGKPTMTLQVGYLAPISEQSGRMQRLNNMGYRAGIVTSGTLDTKQAYKLRSAVEEFQCDNHIEVDGRIGAATEAKLKEVYGC